jgi:hypothetical protein
MAYNKPGVEVTQRQETVSPTLIAPELPAVILGPAYRIVEISERDTDFTHDYSAILVSGAVGTDIVLTSGVSFDTTNLQNIDEDSIYVDIVGTSQAAIGEVLHIPPGHECLTLTPATGNLNVDKTLMSGLVTDPDIWVSGIIKVGWRALDGALANQMISVESSTEIEGLAGKRIPENPLAFGLKMAVANASTATYAVAMSGVTSTDHDDAQSVIAGQEIYSIAPMDMLDSTKAGSYATHCTNRASSTEKIERICFGSVDRTFTDSKSDDASTIAAANLSLGDDRFFSVHPPAGYYSDRRHVSTVNPTYVDAMNGSLGLYAILDEKVKLANGTTYFKGQQITGAVWSGIQSAQSYVSALVPVQGHFWCAAVAGQVAGNPPQQGHTNLPIGGGLSRVKYSNDYFSQAQLNTIAAGGSYIISQSTPVSVPTCRHQLSTDMSSIETRELSITKILDYVSKFIRNGLTPYIGTYNLTDKFVRMMSMTLEGMKNYLIREGVITDLVVLEMSQDASERDTLNVVLDIGVPYPVNYIRITLTF